MGSLNLNFPFDFSHILIILLEKWHLFFLLKIHEGTCIEEHNSYEHYVPAFLQKLKIWAQIFFNYFQKLVKFYFHLLSQAISIQGHLNQNRFKVFKVCNFSWIYGWHFLINVPKSTSNTTREFAGTYHQHQHYYHLRLSSLASTKHRLGTQRQYAY